MPVRYDKATRLFTLDDGRKVPPDRARRIQPSPELREFASKIETERGGYDHRRMNNLKQNRGR